MDLQDEPEYDEDDYGSDYQDKIYISTSVSKKKVAGKESFVVKLIIYLVMKKYLIMKLE